MKDPQEALAAARRTVQERAAGTQAGGDGAQAAGGETAAGAEVLPWTFEDPVMSARQLAQWALIEPDEGEVYSTRRLGAPITVFKRLLIRLLRQYFAQVSGQQSRFNASVAAHVVRLEERVRVLEAAQTGHAPAREGVLGPASPAPEGAPAPAPPREPPLR